MAGAVDQRRKRSVTPEQSPARRPTIIVALAATIGIALVVTGLVLSDRAARADGTSSAERRELIQRAEEFAVTFSTYSMQDLDDYFAQVEPYLTQEFRERFAQQVVPRLEDRRGQDLQSRGQVRASAIGTMGRSQAQVLIALDVTVSGPQVQDGSQSRAFRWSVTFSRAGDTWLVDGQVDVDLAVDLLTDGEGADGEQPEGGEQ